jgi:UDP-glucose 4-epimerase
MRVLITGSQGKVGLHLTRAFRESGHTTVGIDLARGVYDTPAAEGPFPDEYIQADLCDAGAVYSTIARFRPDAVVHNAAIPDPTHNPPHTVFQTNTVSTFNVLEACVRLGVPRVVNLASEQIPGFFASERVVEVQTGAGATVTSGLPSYCPVDEAHPVAPQNPYACSKMIGEQLCDAAVRRCDGISIISIRPSWCQDSSNIARNIGPLVTDPSRGNEGMWSYICIPDLAAAVVLAATKQDIVPSPQATRVAPTDAYPKGSFHDVVYIAAADNAGGRDLKAAVESFYKGKVPVRPLPRVDASGIDCSKAKRVLGWEPRLTWRDYLGADGKLLEGAAGK